MQPKLKKPVPLEGSISKRIVNWLNKQPRCRARKISGNTSVSGEPDIYCCWHGRTIILETKRPKSSYGVTKQQAETMEMWLEAEAIVATVKSLDDVKKLIQCLEEDERS